jgi:hypothetical protein
MAADISALGTLNNSQPLDLDIYKPAQEFRLPPAGRYIVRAPERFESTSFGKSNSGYLKAQVDPTIIGTVDGGTTGQGMQVRYVNVSAKSWTNKQGESESQLGRYLRAAGFKGAIPGDPQSQADAVEQTANRQYTVYLDWRARNNRTGFTVEGMSNFPKLADGTHQSWIQDPEEKDEKGNPVRLRANLTVTRFFAAA